MAFPPSRLTTQAVTFRGSFADPRQALDPVLPEVAFVGRSNVGKSSLLNALVGRKQLARVSGTPGKTQLMNVFHLPGLYLVDLPGYGYARASRDARAEFRRLVDAYLRTRETLAGVVWLLDVRHPPSAEDRAMQELLIESERPILAALTKIDKFAPRRRREAILERSTELGLPPSEVLPVSSETGEGLADLGESLLALMDQSVGGISGPS